MTSTATPGPARAGAIPPSAVHAIYRSVNAWQDRTGRRVARLDVGEPFFSPPVEAVEAIVDAVRSGRTGYTSAEGMLTLREALADKLTGQGQDTDADRVLVCTGAAQGLTALLTSLADPGEEILLPALHWPISLQQSLLAGLTPVCYGLGTDGAPDPEAVLAAASPRTRILLLNSPANPTGAVHDPALTATLLTLARERGWQVVSDEAYEDFVYAGAHVSAASLEADVPQAERVVSAVYSFSKSYAMTGYRLGYVALPDADRAATFRVVQEASILSSPTPVQHAGLAALGSGAAAAARGLVGANRASLAPLVGAGLLDRLPAGGWFAVLDLAAIGGGDADRFAADLLEAEAIALAPASGFALRPGPGGALSPDPTATSKLRLAFCGDPAVVARAAERVADFAGRWRP
jgi:aspartate aminotransferase